MESFLSNKILISLLKQNGVRRLVLSSGTRNIPFVAEVETDRDFECYSVVDERNAAFFAMGISQSSGEAVAIACTSGTAASNYLSGVTEAFYSHVPLVAITFDRSPYMLDQLETQKIDQPAIFSSVCKKSVNLPLIRNEEDIWYANRILNEAFIELRRRRLGPIHINVPLCGDTNEMNVEYKTELSNIATRHIDYYSERDKSPWDKAAMRLRTAKKVLLVIGQSSPMSKEETEAIRLFSKNFQCPVLADHLSNFRCKEQIMTEPVIKALNSKTIASLLPEIVITFGANFQERIKDLLKAHQGEFEHWSIDEEGIVRDVFKSETALFECEPITFFRKFGKMERDDGLDGAYLIKWKEVEMAMKLPDMPFTNFYVAKQFAEKIPSRSILHLSIQNSTRLMQFFELDESITVYSNVNAFGIDGCLPTFMGQAAVTDELAFIMIGDLSFFYGMNALGIRNRKNNIRILLVNNGGGAEFHIQPDSDSRETIDLHIGAAHNKTAKGWAESLGFKYITASDEAMFMENLDIFCEKDHEKPVLFEVFTDMKKDGQFCLSVYRELERCIPSDLKEEEK